MRSLKGRSTISRKVPAAKTQTVQSAITFLEMLLHSGCRIPGGEACATCDAAIVKLRSTDHRRQHLKIRRFFQTRRRKASVNGVCSRWSGGKAIYAMLPFVRLLLRFCKLGFKQNKTKQKERERERERERRGERDRDRKTWKERKTKKPVTFRD